MYTYAATQKLSITEDTQIVSDYKGRHCEHCAEKCRIRLRWYNFMNDYRRMDNRFICCKIKLSILITDVLIRGLKFTKLKALAIFKSYLS